MDRAAADPMAVLISCSLSDGLKARVKMATA